MVTQYFDTMTMCVIFGGIAVIVVCLLLRRLEATQKSVPLWLAAGLIGVLLGSGVSLAAMHSVGYHWTREPLKDSGNSTAGSDFRVLSPGGGPTAPGGGMGSGMGEMGGGMGGMGGGAGGMAGGGANAPRSRRDLTTLVGKLELLTREISLKLNEDQTGKIAAVLQVLDEEDEMTEDAAKAHMDALDEFLTEDNKAVLDAIELPRRPAERAAGGTGGRGGGGTGGGGRSDANPFKQEEQAKRLQSLRDRLGHLVQAKAPRNDPVKPPGS